MLSREIIMGYISNKEFNKVIDYFYDSYMLLIQEFLQKHNITFDDQAMLLDLAYLVKIKYPSYAGMMDAMLRTFQLEEMEVGERIESLMENYKYILEKCQ